MTDMPKTEGRRRPTDEEILRAAPSSASGREVRVGIFVLLGVLSFVIVLFLLTDPATLRGRYMLVTVVDNAGGVRRGDPIQMRGVNIGRVHGFEMEPNERVAITMEMDGEWKIPVDSRTEMGASGIFGGRTLEILPGRSQQMLQPWDTLPGGEGAGGGLLGSVSELSGKADTVLDRIRTILDTGTVASVRQSATELDGLLTELSAMTREQRGTLDRLTKSMAGVAENLDGAAPDARRAIARADSAMAVLAQTGASLDQATASLRTLLGRMERGEGTLGRLSSDEALYENLNKAAESIAALMEDIRANPKRYINLSIF